MVELVTPSSWMHTIFTKPLLAIRVLMNSIPPSYTTRSAVCTSRVLAFFQALRTSPPPPSLLSSSPSSSPSSPESSRSSGSSSPLRIGVAAFCWGGQHAFSLAQDLPASRVPRYHPPPPPTPTPAQDPASSSSGEETTAPAAAAGEEEEKKMRLIDCAFTAHPAFFTIPGDVEKVVVPLSVAIGDADMAIGAKGVRLMKETFDAKEKGKEGGEYECVVLKGAKHGFAVRSYAAEELQVGYANVAEKQALGWFERWMG